MNGPFAVISACGVIWLGLFLYLLSLARRLSRLERELGGDHGRGHV